MPDAAHVAPKVPMKTSSIAGMFMKAAGEVPSITAEPRMPTIAATIPMAVAAFTTRSSAGALGSFAGVHEIVAPRTPPPHGGGVKEEGPGGAGRSEGPQGGGGGRN